MSEKILDPIFLNEKMVLNTAAYLFDGYSLKKESADESKKSINGEASAGATFLSKLFSPISFNAGVSGDFVKSTKSERLFTLGGLHMSVLDELKKKKQICALDLNGKEEDLRKPSFVSANVILKPIDFYEILQILSLLRPLLISLFEKFGDKLIKDKELKDYFSDGELKKYNKLLKSLLNSLENDYLKSRQLEMIMYSPDNGNAIGVIDIPLNDLNPVELKSKLNDGQFFVVGKLTRYVKRETSLSLVERSSISQLVTLLGKLAVFSEGDESVQSYLKDMHEMHDLIERFVNLRLQGPCVRLLSLSISA